MPNFGSGYNCNPSSFAFDSAGNVYVGQADCTGDILKFDAAGNPLAAFDATTGVRGADHIDLCQQRLHDVLFELDQGRHAIRRVHQHAASQVQHAAASRGDSWNHLRILPDGGVLPADSQYHIVRLDASGNQIQNYFVLTESNWWTGLDILADGTSGANNLATGNVYHFNLASGAVLSLVQRRTGLGLVEAWRSNRSPSLSSVSNSPTRMRRLRPRPGSELPNSSSSPQRQNLSMKILWLNSNTNCCRSTKAASCARGTCYATSPGITG